MSDSALYRLLIFKFKIKIKLLNPYTAMGDYSRPKLTKRSLLWATSRREILKKKKKIEKFFLNFFFTSVLWCLSICALYIAN